MAENRIRRMPLPLSLDNQLHAKALTIIENVPKGKRTEFICNKICAGENEELSPALKNAIYECVKQAIRDQGGIAVQPTVIQAEVQDNVSDAKDEIENNLFGFLASLE